jgi:hypothetical protein
MNNLAERFKAFYADLANADLSKMSDLYHEHVIFKDPVHTINSLTKVQDYTADLCRDVGECRFEYLDQLVGESSAYIKWVMHLQHPRLGPNTVRVRGMTHIQFDERIYFHEDTYDLGAMIYEHVPVIGRVIRWLKRRLSGGAGS